MVDINCGDCTECANYGSCKPGTSKFKKKSDDSFDYCMCGEKLYHVWSDVITKPTHAHPTGYTEIALQCRNQECWFVQDEKKRRKVAGKKVPEQLYVIVGYIERSDVVRIKKIAV